MNDPSRPGIRVSVRLLMGYTRAYRSELLLVAILLLLDIGLSVQFSLSFKYLIDGAIGHKDPGLLLLLVLGLLISVTLVTGIGRWRDRRFTRIACRFAADLRSRLFAHVLRLSLDFYRDPQTGNLPTRLSSDVSEIERVFLQLVSQGILPLLEISVGTILALALDWRLAIVAIAAFLLSLAIPLYLSPRTAAAAHTREHEAWVLVHAVEENVAAQALVKAYDLDDVAVDAFEIKNAALFEASRRLGFLTVLGERSTVFSLQILQLLVLAIGGYRAFTGSMTIGTLVALLVIFGTLASAIGRIGEYLPKIARSGSSAARIDKLLAEKPQIADAIDAAPLPRFSNTIEFRHVSFELAGGPNKLEDVSFVIPRAGWAAIVGPSGAGKSTILSLLMRLYDPGSGSILIDGRDLRSVSQDSLRSQMGAVFQETFLFHTTLHENIRVGRPNASDEEVERVAREAEIHEYIAALPDGYKSIAGGGTFSGGQRQRLALARALLRNPEILILDEVTSTLDSATESLINQTLARAAKGRTVLAATHRLETARTADVILFVEQGRLVESGSHVDLIARNGSYARLWRKQSGITGGGQGEGWKVETQLLRDIPILSELDDSILSELTESFLTEVFSADCFLMHEGDPGDKFYILARGKVEVLKRERRATVLQDGDYFGEIALILNTARTASVRTLTECICLVLTREKFQALMSRVPSLRWRLRELAAIHEHLNAEASVPVSPADTVSTSKIRHDLLTPVNQLVGYSELLLEDLPESEHMAAIRDVSKSVQRMIESALPSGQTATHAGLQTLRHNLDTPLNAIQASVAAQARIEGPVNVQADLDKIHAAADRLRAMFDEMDRPAGEFEGTLQTSEGRALAAFSGSSAGHLLVVDDNDRGRELLCRRLGRYGYRVSQASGGRQALEMIESNPFDLVLLDVMMPEVDGFEVLRQLRAMDRLKEVPVIVTTAMDETESAVQCIELGAEDYLPKPFEPVLLRARIGASIEKKRLRDEERRITKELRIALDQVSLERRRSESLLRNILPEQISEELKSAGHVTPKFIDDVTIIFTDFVGFSLSTERMPASELVAMLNEYFTAVDHIVLRYGFEKLKTIGDSYMCMGGLPVAGPSHTVDAILVCMEIVEAVNQLHGKYQENWRIRIGVHTGPVIAGVVGIQKFAFDVWGVTVNLSSRMESAGAPGRINVSEQVFGKINQFFDCEPRGSIQTKERLVPMYFVGSPQPELLDNYRKLFGGEPPSFPSFMNGQS